MSIWQIYKHDVKQFVENNYRKQKKPYTKYLNSNWLKEVALCKCYLPFSNLQFED